MEISEIKNNPEWVKVSEYKYASFGGIRKNTILFKRSRIMPNQGFDIVFSFGKGLVYAKFCETKEEASKLYDELNDALKRHRAAEKEKANNLDSELQDYLANLMKDFKERWFKKMEDYYSNYYDYIREHLEENKKLLAEAEEKLSSFPWRERYSYEYKVCQTKVKNLTSLVVCEEARMEKDEYMRRRNQEIILSWAACLNKFTKKCSEMGVSRNLHTNQVEVTEKGFELLMDDLDNNFTINARIIWCAEDSLLVTPHTRYIVTKKNKK